MSLAHNKKATNKLIVGIVLAIASFILLMGFTVDAIGRDYIGDIEICKATLFLDATTSSIPALAQAVNAKCKTVPLDTLEKIEREDKLKEYLSNRMAEAWNMVHEGKKKELWHDGAFGLAGYNCFIVFDLDYTDPKYKTPITADYLKEYFITTDFKKKKTTYHQYVQNYGGDGAWYFLANLTPGQHYAISVQSPYAAGVGAGPWTEWMLKKLAQGTVSKRGYAKIQQILQANFNRFADPDDLNTILLFSTMDFAVDPNGLNCQYN